MPPWRPGLEGVVAFTGHAVLALEPDITDARLVALGVDGFGGAHDPRLIAALAGDGGLDRQPGRPDRGLAGLPELSIGMNATRQGGGGTTLVKDALDIVASSELVVAAVAPGNAASLRAFLSAGFTPLGSLQLFRRRRV